MKHTIYLQAKNKLSTSCKELKKRTNDKPFIRECLSLELDNEIREFNRFALKERISEKRAELYSVWLSNHVATIQPN